MTLFHDVMLSPIVSFAPRQERQSGLASAKVQIKNEKTKENEGKSEEKHGAAPESEDSPSDVCKEK